MSTRVLRQLIVGALEAVLTFLVAGGVMRDDIGWVQSSIYYRSLMVGRTPNIDRIGNEGGIFTTYYAEQSCTAGPNAFTRLT